MQMKKNFYKRFNMITNKKLIINSLLCSIVLTLYGYLLRYHQNNMTIFEATIVTFNFLEFDLLRTIIPIFVFSLPFISFISFSGDMIYREFFERGGILLTRIQHKKLWFAKMMGELSKESALFCFILIITTAVIHLFLGYNFEFHFFRETVFLGFLLLLFFIMMATLSNIVCFLTKSSLGGIVAIALFYTSIFIVAYIYEWHSSLLFMIKWLPVSQIIISWHSELTVLNNVSFTLGFSYLYLLISVSVLSGVLYKIFEKAENY